MDIIGQIDATLEAWERGPDAARWTPAGVSTGPLPFSDASWRHVAICRDCTSEGRFTTAEVRDEWIREHERRGWRHRDWRTLSFS